MRTLIVSDVHDKIEELESIEKQAGAVNKIVHIGDWTDSYPPRDGGPQNVAYFLKHNINDPKRELIIGNHDLQYMFPNQTGIRCSGYEPFKDLDMGRILLHNRSKFKFTTTVSSWRISHAGFAQFAERFGDDLDTYCANFLQKMIGMDQNNTHIPLSGLLTVGKARGGFDEKGGPLWLDWDKEFEPVSGMVQIVGHTRHDHPQWKGSNLCLDTGLRHFVIIENNSMSVHTANWFYEKTV